MNPLFCWPSSSEITLKNSDNTTEVGKQAFEVGAKALENTIEVSAIIIAIAITSSKTNVTSIADLNENKAKKKKINEW